MSEIVTIDETIQGEIVEQNGMFIWTGALPNVDTQDLIEQMREDRINAILENI